MQIAKQNSPWKRSLNTLLATVLVASSVSFAGAPQQAQAAPVASYVGPGGVPIGEFISHVAVEQSAVDKGSNVFVLNDLAGGFEWGHNTNISPAVTFDHVIGGNINFHQATDGQKTNLLFRTLKNSPSIPAPDPVTQAREIFSVQKSGGQGFPWDFSPHTKENPKGTYADNSITTAAGTTTDKKKIIKPTEVVSSPSILNVLSTDENWRLSINGRSQHTQTKAEGHVANWSLTTDQTAGKEYIGFSEGSAFHDGNIAELLVANKELTPAERHQVNSYLAFKYGITLKKDDGTTDDYIASDSSTKIWTASKNAGYGHRVTGIGLDVASGIDQKQSKSQVEGANITVALGDTIKGLNSENTNSIVNDKSFFTFSDNGGTAIYDTVIENIDLPDVLKHTNATTKTTTKMASLVYKVDKTNWTDSEITLQVDGADENGHQYYLYIHETDAAFPIATTKVYPTNKVTGEVTVNSSEFADGSYFTFIKHVDKKDLETRANTIDAENLVETDYVSGWVAFQQALSDAKAVLIDETKTAGEVQVALDALNAARNSLQGPVSLDKAPGGVSQDLISWIDMEKSVEEGTIASGTVTSLKDLADSARTWTPYMGNGQPETDLGGNMINYHHATNKANNRVQYRTNTPLFAPTSGKREVFSVQVRKGNATGFPWDLGGASGGTKYDNSSIKADFGSTVKDEFIPKANLLNSHILNVWSAENDWRLSINGNKEQEDTTNSVSWNSIASYHHYIGSAHSQTFNGQIAEVLVFNNRLSDVDRKKVNSYLALKYGTTLKNADGTSTDYVASNGTAMWTVINNNGYGNRITGLGIDEVGNINQKQSKSEETDANVAIAVGEFADSNKNNHSSIANDTSFFTFSDNGQAATFVTPLPKNTEDLMHMERIYKVEKTNWQDTNITLQVDKVKDATEWPLYLVVSDDEQFDATDSFHELTDGEITLNSSELANHSYFTIAAPAPKSTGAKIEETVANGNQITLTFDKEVEFTSSTGFTVEIDGVEITVDSSNFNVDPNDKTKLIITLPTNTDVAGKEVVVTYDGTGNLKGTNGVPVNNFTQTVTVDTVVDKSKLQAQVNDAVTKNEADYTPDSWNQFKNALDNAQNVLNDSNATQQQVEDALNALKDAQDKLVSLTPDALTITQPDLVTNDSFPTAGGKVETSTTTPSTIEIVFTDGDGKRVMGGTASIDHETGEWSFTTPIGLPDGSYTITATATNPDWKESVIKTHTFTIGTIDKTALQNKADESKGLNQDNYTPDSWLNYKNQLDAAQTVLDNPNATQAEVDAALDALTAAQDALVPVATVDKSKLQAKANEKDRLSASNYTSSSWSNYLDKLNAAQAILNNPNATQAEVDAALNALTAAQNALVYTGNSGSGGGDNSWVPTTETGSTTTKILVELEIDGDNPLAKTTVEIERTTDKNGRVSDLVKLTEENAREAVAKAKEIGNNVARIVLPDANDEVDEVTVEILQQSVQLLRDNGLDLEISTKDGLVTIPTSSLNGVDNNFYFRLVPVKKADERKAIEDRARVEQVVRETMGSNDINVLARPMTIETNMPNRPVIVTLPLKDVAIPTDAAERQAFLDRLAVFIEHTDGEKKVVKPTVVTMANGELGLQFTVEKFSTFTIIQVNEKEEVQPEMKQHEAYIKGFENGTFGPDKHVTRAQIALMIARILGYEDEAANNAPFKDVARTHYAAGAIAFVKEAGIMNGNAQGNFNAGEKITRAEMATVVANYKELDIQENGVISFNDTKGHWAQWIIEANRNAGIINGRQDNRFAPNDSLTRAEAVVMINRMIERGPLNGVTYSSFSDVKTTHWAFENIEEAANDHSYIVDENGEEKLSK